MSEPTFRSAPESRVAEVSEVGSTGVMDLPDHLYAMSAPLAVWEYVESLQGALRRCTSERDTSRSLLARFANEPYVTELENRLRAACEPCAECGHIDWRELDDCLPAASPVPEEQPQ